MANSPNPAPAGAESAPTRLSDADAIQQLERFGFDGEEEQDDGDASAEAEPKQTDPNEPESDDAPEGEPTDDGETGAEDEGPEDDASEPEPDDGAEPKATEKDKTLVSRDGEKVPASELWKARDRAREYDRILPQIQQEHQRFQQDQQKFTAEKQQFDTYAKQIAQVALDFLPPEPDRALMDRNSPSYDPFAWQEQKFARDTAVADFNQKFHAVAQAQQQATQTSAQEVEQQRAQQRQQAVTQFFGAHPELQAPDKQQAFAQDFHAVADAVGFSREERQDVLDPRLYKLTMLAARGLKAMQGEAKQKTVTNQRQAIAAKKVTGAPPVAAPAARQTAATRDARVQQATLERLRKNPSDTKAALDALALVD